MAWSEAESDLFGDGGGEHCPDGRLFFLLFFFFFSLFFWISIGYRLQCGGGCLVCLSHTEIDEEKEERMAICSFHTVYTYIYKRKGELVFDVFSLLLSTWL
jgi:hypothetical protein